MSIMTHCMYQCHIFMFVDYDVSYISNVKRLHSLLRYGGVQDVYRAVADPGNRKGGFKD